VLLGKVFASALRVGSTVRTGLGIWIHGLMPVIADTWTPLGQHARWSSSILSPWRCFMARRDATSVSSSPALWLTRSLELCADAHAPDHAGSVDDHGNTLQAGGHTLHRCLVIVAATQASASCRPIAVYALRACTTSSAILFMRRSCSPLGLRYCQPACGTSAYGLPIADCNTREPAPRNFSKAVTQLLAISVAGQITG